MKVLKCCVEDQTSFFSVTVDQRLRATAVPRMAGTVGRGDPAVSASHLTHLVVLSGLTVVTLRLRLALGLTWSLPLVLMGVRKLILVLRMLLLVGLLSSSSLQGTFTRNRERERETFC